MAFALVGCGGTSVPPVTQAPTPSAGLFVDAGQDLGKISPFVYGTNFGPWLAVSPERQPDVVAAKVTFVTFPGGNWGDENNITEKQIDDFVAFCRQIGAEPRIVARLKGGSPEAAAALVKYANVTQGYKIRYWGVGNEADLYNQSSLPGYTVAEYVADWRTYAQAMKAVDPSIKLVGPDISQFVADPVGPYLLRIQDWLTSFLKANGDLVDVVSIHRYPFPTDDAQTPPTIDQLRASSAEWDATIPYLRKLIREGTGKDLPVAVTEINSSWAKNVGGEATLDSHYNAIWYADVLGRLIRQKVDIVAQFALTGEYGLMDSYTLFPTYYVWTMYQHFGSELVRAVSDDPLVSVYAARRNDGKLAVLLVNLGSAPAMKPLTIVGAGKLTSADTWLFDASHNATAAGSTVLGGSVTLPPESITVLVTG